MTWNYVDFTNNETREEIIEAFSSDDTIHEDVVIIDKKGDNLLRIFSFERNLNHRQISPLRDILVLIIHNS